MAPCREGASLAVRQDRYGTSTRLPESAAKTGTVTVTSARIGHQFQHLQGAADRQQFLTHECKVGTIVTVTGTGLAQNHGRQLRRRGGDDLLCQLRYPRNRNRSKRSDNPARSSSPVPELSRSCRNEAQEGERGYVPSESSLEWNPFSFRGWTRARFPTLLLRQGRPTRRRRSLKRSSERYRSKIGSTARYPIQAA
jgi:hypothetical protein